MGIDTATGFESWYRSEHPRLVAAMAVVAGDTEVAREVTAEAFARALERWGRVHGHLLGWRPPHRHGHRGGWGDSSAGAGRCRGHAGQHRAGPSRRGLPIVGSASAGIRAFFKRMPDDPATVELVAATSADPTPTPRQ